jgi:hypothetical protein
MPAPVPLPYSELIDFDISEYTPPRKPYQNLTIECLDGSVCCIREDLIANSGYFARRYEFDPASKSALRITEPVECQIMLLLLCIIDGGYDPPTTIELIDIMKFYDVRWMLGNMYAGIRLKMTCGDISFVVQNMSYFIQDRNESIYEQRLPAIDSLVEAILNYSVCDFDVIRHCLETAHDLNCKEVINACMKVIGIKLIGVNQTFRDMLYAMDNKSKLLLFDCLFDPAHPDKDKINTCGYCNESIDEFGIVLKDHVNIN